MKLPSKLPLLFLVLLFSTLNQVWSQEDEADEDLTAAPLADESVSAATEKKSVSRGGKETGVLDFEGELIEGTRKRPDLFLQTGLENLTLDAILFLRKDFNDYHQVDRNRRPGFIERKSRRTR